MASLWAFSLTALTSLVLTFLMMRFARRVGLIDHPGERKVHRQPTPRGGGVAIYLALLVTALLVDPVGRAMPILGLGLGYVLLGLLDDWRPLPWQLRLGIQTLLAVVAVRQAAAEWSWLGAGVAVLWIVSLVNAFNMLDNMDALSAGVAWIAAGTFALETLLRDGTDAPALFSQAAFMGALTGFLVFNWPPARIFMGDAGSTFLGFFLAVTSLQDAPIDPPDFKRWAMPIFVLAVPCYDLTTVVALRLWQGKSPFHADKQHLSHRLAGLGLGSVRAVRVIYVLGLASGLAGVALASTSQRQSWLLTIQLAAVWMAVALIEYVRHFRAQETTPD